MSKDPLDEFGRLIKQVKVTEYERGWREAMEAIQRAAVTLYRQSAVASEAAADNASSGAVDALRPLQAAAEPPPEPEPAAPGQTEEPLADNDARPSPTQSESPPRFVTPKWALLKR
ncbi:MAG: hypothetical protein EXQ88_00450 [Alphaproteobacteria bacterium]|nr:hypothetical protein [Alphaproteobacteria bacterium]